MYNGNGKELVGARLVAARPACKPPFPRGPLHPLPDQTCAIVQLSTEKHFGTLALPPQKTPVDLHLSGLSDLCAQALLSFSPPCTITDCYCFHLWRIVARPPEVNLTHRDDLTKCRSLPLPLGTTPTDLIPSWPTPLHAKRACPFHWFIGEINGPGFKSVMLPRVDQRFILDSPTWSPPLIGWGLWLKHNCTPCLCTLSRWPRRDAIRLTDYVLSGDEVIPFFLYWNPPRCAGFGFRLGVFCMRPSSSGYSNLKLISPLLKLENHPLEP